MKYEWAVIDATRDDLQDELNRLEAMRWEVFQLLGTATMGYVIVVRKQR